MPRRDGRKRDNLLVDINVVEIGNCLTESFIADLNRAHVEIERANNELQEQIRADSVRGIRRSLAELVDALRLSVFDTVLIDGGPDRILRSIDNVQSTLRTERELSSDDKAQLGRLSGSASRFNSQVFQKQVDSLLDCLISPDIPTNIPPGLE